MSSQRKYFISDVSVMFGRTMRHITRSVDTIITVCITPIAMMLLFVYVLGGAIETGAESYINYILPGITVMTIGSGIAYVGYRLFNDKQNGIFDRFHSMPISRSTVLWGHVLTSVISNMISVVVVILVAFLMGFRPSASVLNWLAVFGILIVFTLALTWVAVIAGIAAKTTDGAVAFSYPIIFLPFISSAFVPTDTMPKAVRIFAENQPVTPIVNSIRSLLVGESATNDLWTALAWCAGITVIAYLFSIRLYKKM